MTGCGAMRKMHFLIGDDGAFRETLDETAFAKVPLRRVQ